MRRFGEKLHSARGASLLFALLVFLVCALAGAAALTAAASNAGRYSHLRDDQQKYLTLSSAAKLVRGELSAGTFTASATLTMTKTWTLVNVPDTKDPNGNVIEKGYSYWRYDGVEYDLAGASAEASAEDKTAVCTGALTGWLEAGLVKLFNYRDVPAEWWTLANDERPAAPGEPAVSLTELTAKAGDAGTDGWSLEDVSWSLEADGNYGLTAAFLLPDGEYRTILKLPANVSVSQEVEGPISSVINGIKTETTTTTVTAVVTWPADGSSFTQVKWSETETEGEGEMP